MPSFGELLRQRRLAAGLTQEALAERAGVSAKAISDLERDPGRTPRLDTVGLLADALGPDERTALLAVAVDGRAHSDVAEELGLTDGAVRQLVHRARTTLRGAVTGLSLRHDRGAVARAALEGIACGVRARLRTLGRTSAPATELRVSGGSAGMAVWNQIKADVTGIPVVRVAGDSTAAGAAMLAGLGAGVYRDVAEAVAAGYRPLGRAEPDPAHRALYDDLYERYQALTGSQVVR